MQQAVIYSRAKLAKAETEGKSNVEEIQQLNLAIERAKYKSFWVGVNRGISFDSKNPREADGLGAHRTTAKHRGRSKGLIDPHGKYKLIWDGVISLLIIYSIIMIPVRLAFEPANTLVSAVLEDIILVLFTIDIIVNFNTTFVDPATETVVHNRKAIAMQYLKFWFWVDALSTFPFNYAADLFATDADLGMLRAIRALRLFRIFKLFRVSKFNETLQNFRINPQVVSLVVLILCIFFIAHVFACIWHFMALTKEQTTGGETWVNTTGLDEKTIYDRYVASLYYVMVTMMTIGYGDIHPVTDNERIFAIATMLTGGVVFGAMISRLASILEKRNPEAKALRQHMVEFKSYLMDIAPPKELRKRVVDAYGYYMSKKSVYGEPSFFDQLPQPILYRLVRQMDEDSIRRVTLFHTYEMDFVVPLLLALKPFQASAGDVIFDEGDICDSIVFLKKGKVAISSSNGYTNVLAGYVRAGGYFGDMEYLRNTTCIATYSAYKHSHLLAVSHQTFNQAAAKCLDAGHRFQKQNQARYELFNKVLKQNRKGMEMENTQRSTEDTRILVNRLMSTTPPLSSSNLLVTPKHRKSLSEAARQMRRSLTTAASSQSVHSLWIDGVLVAKRKIGLLAHPTDHPPSLDQDEILLRVIYVDEHGKIAPGEVPASYLTRRLIINPLDPYKLIWDAVIAVMVCYSVMIIPMEIGFNRPAFNGSETVEMVTNAFFLLDILVCIRTAFFEDDGDHLVIVQYTVAYQYCKDWLLIDLLGSLPFDLIFASFSMDSIDLTFTKLLKSIRILRLLKLMRLLKLGYISEELEERLGLSPAAMNLLMMLLQVFFVGHLVACLLFGASTAITDNPWYANSSSVYPSQVGASLGSQYILSLYWTFTIMSTVGYGDILPGTTEERILNIFVILLGASIFGYMIANVSALLQSLNSSDGVRDEKIGGITEYLDEKQCPMKLQDAVVKHFRNYYKDSSPYDVDTMLARLPPKLTCEILVLHHQNTLRHIAVLPYIKNVSVRLYIFNLMKPVYYEPNEYMLKQGTQGNEIHFLVEGRAVAFKRKLVAKKEKKKQTMLGSMLRQTSTLVSTMLRSPSVKKEEKASAPSFVKRQSSALSPASLATVSCAAADNADAEGKINVRNTTQDSIRLSELLDRDAEPGMPQSPPPPMPDRMNRFNISLRIGTNGWEDSDSEDGAEYEALREDQTPLYSAPVKAVENRSAKKGATFSFPDWDISFAGNKADNYEDSEAGESDLDDNRSHHVKIDPTFTWTPAEIEKKGMVLIGDITPGDFVGHLSLMHDTINQASVVTSAFSTVYILNKQDISPMLVKQPTVAIQLQMALSRAIATQADVLGKFHMRQTRSKFLAKAKHDFYHKIDVTPVQVKRIRSAQKNKMKRLAKTLKHQLTRRPAGKKQRSFYLSRASDAHPNADLNGIDEGDDEDCVDDAGDGDVADSDGDGNAFSTLDNLGDGMNRVMEGLRNSPIRKLSSGQLPLPQDVPAEPEHVLTKRKARKVRRVESVLTKYSVLYESDDSRDEEAASRRRNQKHRDVIAKRKQHLQAHRTPLPFAFSLRSAAVRRQVEAAEAEHPHIPKRKLSFAERSENFLTDRFWLLSNDDHSSLSGREISLHRVVSLNDLETLEPAARLSSNDTTLLAVRGDPSQAAVADAAAAMRSAIVPIWTNRRALGHEGDVLTRRQSFPSLDNDLWKVSTTCQGLF